MTMIPDEQMLRQGAIFRKMHQFQNEGEKYRFFIVMNFDPKSDKVIILTTTTTQYQSLERRYKNATHSPLVYFHPNECSVFTRFCVINCMDLKVEGKDELLSTLETTQHEFVGMIPENKLQEILDYVIQAQDIPPSKKSLIISPLTF